MFGMFIENCYPLFGWIDCFG